MNKRGPDQYENDGYINREHLGSGTAASNNFLRGDHVWATIPSGSAAGSYNILAAGTQTVHPTWQSRNQEAQMFGLSHYREVAQDLICTLTKR